MMKDLTFLTPLARFFGAGLLIASASRLALALLLSERVAQTPDRGLLFLVGLRFDAIVMSYLSALPLALSCLLPAIGERFLRAYYPACLLLVLFLELATPPFILEYDTRPNRLFLEYLIYPREIFSMLVAGHALSLVLVGSVMLVALYLLVSGRLGKYFRAPPSRPLARLALFPFLALALVAGARGSLTSKRPVNASNAIFSSDQMVNSLALNSAYAVARAAYALKYEVSPARLYGRMEDEEVYRRVRNYASAPPDDFVDPALPLHRRQLSTAPRPRNIVIFLQESLGAGFVGCLGGLPLTPRLDDLSREGCLFTNLYCTGTRSVRGIEAVVAGFLPSPSESVVKLEGARSGFATIAGLLQRRGYRTSFIYGGMSNFDNMGAFFAGNGFDVIIDEQDFDPAAAAFKGVWGYSDEDLAREANDYFKSLGDAPFFSLLFSTSNHDPFEFPAGRVALFRPPANTVYNAIKYADYSLGRFFDLARREDYFHDTIFLVAADHDTRVYGRNLIPLDKFRVPALLLGPGVPAGERREKLASQIDLPVTLLALSGVDTEHPMPGRDLLHLPDSVPGRAIMQFMETHAFRVEDRLVILQPDMPPLQFRVANDTTFIPAPLDPSLVRDALAHALAPELLYKNKLYGITR
ncbi:MAG: LTA synthase family protein [Odoribacteraceae bacterium]|jgi:phosphoglycerol transferase MdoB-like AlkP superfamily enzyme|nr:LTA synthase family protein [Odoribacteraceae bacterium]